MKIESEKCAEVFRIGPGKFTFFCAYCTRLFEIHNEALDHIETHFSLENELKSEESRFSAPKRGDDTKPIEFVDEFQPSISQISFSNEFECTDEIKVEPHLMIPEKIPIPKNQKTKHPSTKVQKEKEQKPVDATTKDKPKRIRKRYDKSTTSYSKWGYIGRNGIVECDICQQKRQKRNMYNHMQRHSDQKAPCPICQKEYKLTASLKNHIYSHSKAKQKFYCHICPSEFNSVSNLNAHIRTHAAEKNNKCEICGKLFGYVSTLNTHMRIHTGERPYDCKKCDKSFYGSGSFWEHMRRHNNERKFKCNSCDMSFITKAYLRRHSMTHTGERPFSCNVCNAGFIKKSQYNQHLLLHTGEKPYKCRFCDVTFAQSASRRLHERNVHNDICRQTKVAI